MRRRERERKEKDRVRERKERERESEREKEGERDCRISSFSSGFLGLLCPNSKKVYIKLFLGLKNVFIVSLNFKSDLKCVDNIMVLYILNL